MQPFVEWLFAAQLQVEIRCEQINLGTVALGMVAMYRMRQPRAFGSGR